MVTPPDGFCYLDGRRFPRVTSILDQLQNPFLSRWLLTQERGSFRDLVLALVASTQLGDTDTISRADTLNLVGAVEPDTTSGAAEFGSRLHGAIERFLRDGDTLVDTEIYAAFDLWRRWWVASGFRAVAVEQRVGCAGCGFGGSLDCVAEDQRGALLVLDWKSGKTVSPTAALQASAYAHCYPQPIAGGIVLRIGHTSRSKVTPHRFDSEDLKRHFSAFKHALELWRWQRSVAGQDVGDAPLGHVATLPTVTSSAA